MDGIILHDWAAFAIRWVHVITAIAWIGSSFYFIALDLSLRKAPACPKRRMARNGRSTAAASTTSPSTWSRPSGCPST